MAAKKDAKKKAHAKRASQVAIQSEVSALVSSLNALLHTMRCIEQHEPQLCTLMHEVRSAGTLSPDVQEELRILLDEMPHGEYTHDLNSVIEAANAPMAKLPEEPSSRDGSKARSKKKLAKSKDRRK